MRVRNPQEQETAISIARIQSASCLDDDLLPGVSVVIPVYRSQATLAALVEELASVLPTLANCYEVLLVNDGSPDGSWQVICELARRFPWVRGIDMMRNYGQHNAILCGIRAARCETIVTMDDDLQHPPIEIPKLLAKLQAGYDVVYGTPAAMTHSRLRNLLSRGAKRFFSLATGNKNIQDINAFRAFRTHLRAAFAEFRSPHLQIDMLLSWGTQNFTTATVRHEPRKVGRSNYSFLKLFNHTMLLLTGFSTAPLRLASITGMAFTGLGFLVMLYAVIRFFVGEAQPGFPFIAAIISIFSGIQLFILGIIGEYLARMFNRSLERPPYVTNQQVGRNELGRGTEREAA